MGFSLACKESGKVFCCPTFLRASLDAIQSDGSYVEFTTGVRAESYGGTDRRPRWSRCRGLLLAEGARCKNCVQKTVEVIQLVFHEGIQERIAEQVVDIPLPQIMEEMMGLQSSVAPRRPLALVQHPRWFESTFSSEVAVGKRSLWDASPGVVSQPLCHLVGFRVAAPSFVPPLPGGRRPLTHSPRREVVSRPAQLVVPTPRLLGVSQQWRS